MKFYRCGDCGQPTDELGNPLSLEECKSWNGVNAELVHGYCCIQPCKQMVQITRDMAIDAGDRSLEGEWVEW